jgi:hypothetical protein
MGYYTKYSLEIISPDESLVDDGELDVFQDEISIISSYNNPFYEEIKWYDHEKYMREFSKKHPEYLFKLYGETEDHDLWLKYFRNGKMQFCSGRKEIKYQEFNPLKLY